MAINKVKYKKSKAPLEAFVVPRPSSYKNCPYREDPVQFSNDQRQVHFRVDARLHKEVKKILHDNGLTIGDFSQFVYLKLGMHDKQLLELVAEFQLEKSNFLLRSSTAATSLENANQAELIYKLIANSDIETDEPE